MRFASLASLLLGPVTLAALPACVSEDAVPAYVGVAYQVRCLGECENVPDSPIRRIYAVDGEQDLTVRCEKGTSGGQDVLSFRATCPGDGAECSDTRYEFEVTGLSVNNDGDPGAGCQVSIREGSNTYETGCTGGALTHNDRCKIDFDVNTADSEVTGTLRCLDIPNAAAPTNTRYVVAPGTEEDTFEFVAQGCEGL